MNVRFPVIRKAVLCVFFSLLTGCAKPSSPAPLPPSLCNSVRAEPVIPDAAGFVAPADEVERVAYRAGLNWIAEVLDWGRENATRAETARKLC